MSQFVAWTVAISGLVIAVVAILLMPTPGPWADAVAVKICHDGTPILRRADGTIWARRSGLVAYRVENENIVC